MAINPEERRGWAAIIYSTGVADVFGALRGSPRLHWTQEAARQEAEEWVSEMKSGPIHWQALDDLMTIGRVDGHVVVVRSILLPRGDPPPA